MDDRYRWEKLYIVLIDFVFPIPLTVIMWFAWYARTQSLYFASYVLLLGLCFGYVIPGIGTNILHLWRFTWRFRMGDYFLHHGFMYAPYFALVLYVMFGGVEDFNSRQVLATIAGTGSLQSLLSSHHDFFGVKIGMIKINNRPARDGKSAAEIIWDWHPIGFMLFGASYAASCMYAYKLLVIDGTASLVSLALLVCGGVAFMGLTSVPYLLREWDTVVRRRETQLSAEAEPATEKSAFGKGGLP